VYNTECIYDPNSDHRRKGVYKNDDGQKSRNATLHTLIQALLNYPEDEAFDLVRELRRCESLETVAERIAGGDTNGFISDEEDEASPVGGNSIPEETTFERQLYGKMGDLRLDDGTVRYIGGTSNLIHVEDDYGADEADEYPQQENAVTSWTNVTDDPHLVVHLLNMYFTWHYTYFTTLSKTLFYRDFLLGKPPPNTRRKTHYCTSLLVNAILALGCHFTSHPGAREDPKDSATAGDHFSKEAKRLIKENDEHERPRLTNIQAFALMSVREAGCGREAKGWVYSGMAFRMACDMGLNLNTGQLTTNKHVNGDDAEEDVRRITFWGCYLFDKCWSNYLGRLPQLPTSIITVPKYEVFPDEDSAEWGPYTDSGFSQSNVQPARTRAVSLQISKLCEISNDLITYFYNPLDMEKNRGKSAELKMLSDIHTRLEAWRKGLPTEMEPREGLLSSVLVMHMFFQLLFIHLFRPFLKYTQTTSPLPPSVSPRKLCTQAAAMISKLMRLYKRSHGLRQICNIAVYISHSACTIHLLNLPDRNSKRDITHGVKHLEEISEGWLCARRSLGMLAILARKWKIALPDEALTVLARTEKKFGKVNLDIQGQSPTLPRHPSDRMMSPSQFATVPINSQQANRTSTDQLQRAVSTSPTTGVPPQPNMSQNSQNTNAITVPISVPEQQVPATLPRPSQQQYQPQPQQQLSASAPVPQQTPTHHRLASDPRPPRPTDMFGGVEQLLRESSDWVYGDAAQIAQGFGNWTNLGLEPSTWANAVVADESMGIGNLAAGAGAGMGWAGAGVGAGVFGSGQMPGAVGGNGTGNANVNAAGLGGDANGVASSAAMSAYPVMDWLNSQTLYNNMAAYNEDEWYGGG